MITNATFQDPPEIGQTYYLVEVFFANTGENRLDASTEPQRKNMSFEPCIEGWLGTTDNIDHQAIGAYRVDQVLSERPHYWSKGWRVELSKIMEADLRHK